MTLSWLPATLLLLPAPSATAFSFSAHHSKATSTTTLFQAHQEINDFREGIRSSREGHHPDDAIDVVMKFGGSSLADYSRVDHVAKLIQGQIAAGYRPRAVVCSAMGKTTNALLSAGDFALGKHQKEIKSCVAFV